MKYSLKWNLRIAAMVGIFALSANVKAQQQMQAGFQANYQSQQQPGYQPQGMLPPGSIQAGNFATSNMPGANQYAPVPIVGEQPSYVNAGGINCGVDRNGNSRIITQGGAAVQVLGH